MLVAMKAWIVIAILAGCAAVACGGGGGSSQTLPTPAPSSSPRPWLPLSVGDTWSYACYLGSPAPGASTFPKSNAVIGTQVVSGTTTFAYEIQVPTSPTNMTEQIQLLADDAAGNTVLFGYLAAPGASPEPIASPTIVIAQNPGSPGSVFDYPAENGGTVSRFFFGNIPTHPTVFGVFQVDAYYEGSHTFATSPDCYGYAPGLGSMEEDHNFTDPDPNKRIDCLITSTPPP